MCMLAKDNSYGKAKVKEKLLSLAKNGVESKLTVFENKIPEDILSQIDIVTNSGNLRPLDKHFIGKLNKNCVIPLMYEAWEKRDSDIDFSECFKRHQNSRNLGRSFLKSTYSKFWLTIN